jgi:uncharacterized protein (TIGR02246 family)
MTVAYDQGAPAGDDERAVAACYERLIGGWNARDAGAYAAPFADDGIVVGYDGSEQHGREAIAAEMGRIFADHETAGYVAKVRAIRLLGSGAALLRAVVGMVPPGGTELMPDRHAHQTVVAARRDDSWRIVLFQNTPAQFHGRPDLAERLEAELREVASTRAAG